MIERMKTINFTTNRKSLKLHRHTQEVINAFLFFFFFCLPLFFFHISSFSLWLCLFITSTPFFDLRVNLRGAIKFPITITQRYQSVLVFPMSFVYTLKKKNNNINNNNNSHKINNK